MYAKTEWENKGHQDDVILMQRKQNIQSAEAKLEWTGT